MSRRKQPKPRHIETDDELATLLQNESESRSPSNSSNPADDAHVCGKCREEFLGLAEFLAHKKTCSRKRLVLVCNESENNLMNEENLDVNYNPKVPKLIDQYEYPCIGSDAEDEEDDEDDMDNFDDDENEIMDAEDREIANEEIDEDLIKISMMNAAANGMTDEEDEVNDDDDDNDGDDNNNEKRHNNFDEMSEKYGDGSKRDKSGHPHPAMFPFSQAMPSSNVTLEPMMATRAAVAQFAENNALPSDVSMLQTTLYSLQQQQLVQLQLIHQLQQQIIMGTHPPMIPNGALPLMPPLSSSSSKHGSHSQESAMDKSVKEKKDTDHSKSEQLSGADIKSELESMASMSTTSSMPSGTSAIPSALPLPSNNMMTPSAQPSEFAKLTKLVERSQYVSEDPFFRHKCRLCHKVFGSDRALQIHIRSHTGERPFKCNICGNRFTTRGNLKVHFERHKAKYPHVKMNPHPVPEHLDKMPPMPIIGSPFPSSAPIHPPLQSGIMNSTAPMSIAPMMSSMYSRMGFTPKPIDVRTSPSEEQNLPSPTSSTNTPVTSPTPTAPEAPASKSPNVSEAASLAASSESTSTAAITSRADSSPTQRFTSPLMSSMPQVTPASSYPLLSPLPSAPPPLTPTVPVGSTSRDSILPSKMIDQDENLEKYMEIDRSSETSKLQQLVDNLENKVSDPNQCVICHRVLSCKSALQMHYRIHTGERPYKCKICRRAFTTKGNLKTHMGVHRMKPPIRMMHQCPVCHKSFTNLLVLQQHIRSHATPPGMPPLPDMTHFNAMHNFPPPMDWSRPYDLSFRRYPDKELDLSRSSSMFHSKRMENEMNDIDDIEDQYGDDEESMDIDGEMPEIKQEADVNYKNEENPSGDSGAGSEEGHHSSIDEEEKKLSRDERPSSAVSEVSRDSGRSPSPNSENDRSPVADAAHTYPSLANSSSVSSYNTSLAALEERVRAIDSSMLQSPMNRFNPFMLNGFQPPISNGDHNPLMKSPNMPYGSESGSDGNGTGDDESKPGTPALSVNSDGGSSIMSGLRDGDKTTTCNICLKAFACRSALDIHYRSHTKERPYKCGVCDRSFSTKGNMKQHMLTHKIRDLPNSFNNNSNSSASHENNNSNDSISDEKKDDMHVTPESTPPASNNDSGSSRHSNGIGQNTSNGGDVSPFLRRTPLKHQCQVCQKGFSSASALQIHIRTHTGDKPFKCNVCGKAFTTKGNLKVHMGTHMWNNSPSRRGRRMSIEPPFMLAHKENPYMTGFPHRSTPDFFPFQFPPFMNGVPPHKMNEISVIQSLSGGMGHLPAMSLSSDHMMSPRSKGVDSSENKSDSWRKSDSNGNVTSTGELDLSMKSSSSTSPNNNNKQRSPSGDTWNSAWKTMCHLCNQNFPSPTALDNHMQNFHLKGGESHSKSLVA